MTKTLLAALVATLALSAAAEARSIPAMRQAGTLACAMNPGVGLVFGSTREVACTFDHVDRRGRLVRESYVGTMDRSGVDLGLTSDQTVSWAVVTPGGVSRRGMMSGAFMGTSSDATVIVGSGTQSLLGTNGRVALQPVGNSGQVGLGIGAGATALQLQRVPNASYTSFR